ncbi:MAG TPA: diguanylate cyclase [Steroidobacteraceae bacterium]
MPETSIARHGDSLIARTIKRGFPFLRFEKELEREFQDSQHEMMRRRVRVSLVLALTTVMGFAVMDHWLVLDDGLRGADVVRFGLQLPIVIACLFATSARYYRRWFVPGIQIAAPVFGIGSVLLAMAASGVHLSLISSRLVLVAFFFYFMAGMSFYAALRTNLIVFVGYAVGAIVTGAAPELAIYHLYILLCANLFAGAGSYALEHANRLAFLERRLLTEVALHDGLTGLLNRAAFEDQIRRVWDQAVRDKVQLSVIMIDIDHFKAYNDRYGHQAGDHCLRHVSQAVRRAALRRPLDFVARYGGEEIVAVLYGADLAFTEITARAILDQVTELAIPHAGSATKPWVTVSVGGASLEPSLILSHDAVIHLADRALYAAKDLGRSRCVVLNGESPAPFARVLEDPSPIRKTAS